MNLSPPRLTVRLALLPALGETMASHTLASAVGTRASKVPPVMTRSVSTRPTGASLKLRTTVAFWPALRAVTPPLAARLTVGARVSISKLRVLLASKPSVLRLPAASWKLPLAMLSTMVPL